MLNPLKLLRYLVFVVFLICNAIITSVAVWNLSIVVVIPGDVVAKEISSYLIFLGTSGLIVVFTVFFVDLYGTDVFLCRVWFELLWVGLFLMMELAGAAAITAQSNGQTCGSNTKESSNLFSQVSPCASTQVLQAFTWVCAILLMGYLSLLFASAIVKYRDNYRIWRCSMRKFLWLNTYRAPKSIPASTASLPRFHTQVPIIAAPRPRPIITIPEPVLTYRSGLSLDYEIEHYQPPALAAADLDGPTSPLPSTLPVAAAVSPIRNRLEPQRKLEATISTPFYPACIQSNINSSLQRPSTAHLSQSRQLPLESSPPPLGDWPRRDATSQPRRARRKPARRDPPPTPVPYSFTMPPAIRQRQPFTTPLTRPSGPRRRSNSGENHRPPNSSSDIRG